MFSAQFFTQLRAKAIGRLSRYCDLLVQYQPLGHDAGEVLGACSAPHKCAVKDLEGLGRLLKEDAQGRHLVLLNGNLNYSFDIEELLRGLHGVMGRRDRIVAVAYSPYWAWLHRLARRAGLRRSQEPWTFITHTDLEGLARLAGFEVLAYHPVGSFPLRAFGLGAALDGVLSATPFLRDFSFATVLVLRPLGKALGRPSLSIVIPARDEKGNIRAALERLPQFGASVEVLFVEGNSSDGTWEEIQAVMASSWPGIEVRACKQPGKGKADAVREGFKHCRNDLLVVLDADLTMPPELLPRFYDAYARGDADFINGSRLVYPMEGDAMRFLNWLGNIFFAKALSFTLDTRLSDSLCGTKLFSRRDHQAMLEWNRDFGRFDPFGDYEMLFPAAELGLGLVDVPIRYRDRSYGSTKIHRFRDGSILLKMTAIGLWRIRLGVGR